MRSAWLEIDWAEIRANVVSARERLPATTALMVVLEAARGTIVHEIVTCLGARLPRRYVK